MIEGAAQDTFDAALALGASGLLKDFNRAGILSTSDVHVAVTLARLGAITDEVVCLGAALAARAPRLGHVCVDLASIAGSASTDSDTQSDLGALPWPEPAAWLERMAASPLVGDDLPLHLVGSNLYLDRLWADEVLVATDLRLRATRPSVEVDEPALRADLAVLFPATDETDLQRLAAITTVRRRISVIAGGPGTGKTTTVARALAALDGQAAATGARPPLVALAAPTGKAAARLEEAVHGQAQEMGVSGAVRDRLLQLKGLTLHRLLGFNPGNRTRFRHDRFHHLPHDVVVVDETSMVSLSMMARLLEAVRPDARVILVGDPEQLASVEAGAVLGDIVGPAARAAAGPGRGAEADAQRSGDEPGPSGFADGIVVLSRNHRFGGAIADLAEAIQAADADEAMGILAAGHEDVAWIAGDGGPTSGDQMAPVRELAVHSGRAVIEAARAGQAAEAIAALAGFRLLCAHRQGPEGVATWTTVVENWLRADVAGFVTGRDWYVGRPLIVTENDYGLQLYNGDTGVVMEGADGRLVAAFERGGAVVHVSPTRLAAVDSVYAMTVHKSQGSQFSAVALLLPSLESRVLTRELLYTAVTRARDRLVLVGPERSIRAAIDRRITRASGLRQALWGDAG
ncbi:MAG TPA: exodeoxyribonuclease V subunit alpha [Acidimicrobiales bacterium]|nr:exodeoxyribonuclease V subunit alpha [Acidimicrobiales bacterium]